MHHRSAEPTYAVTRTRLGLVRSWLTVCVVAALPGIGQAQHTHAPVVTASPAEGVEPSVETSDACPCALQQHATAQDDDTSTGPTIELVGMLGIAFSPDPLGVAITFGGPRLSLRVDDWRFAVGFYPSILYNAAWEGPKLRPGLGFGPEVSYKQFVVYSATYFVEYRFRPLVGLGWRF